MNGYYNIKGTHTLEVNCWQIARSNKCKACFDCQTKIGEAAKSDTMLPLIGVAIGVVVFEAAAVLMSTALCAGQDRKPKALRRYGGGGAPNTSIISGLAWGGFAGGTAGTAGTGGNSGCTTGGGGGCGGGGGGLASTGGGGGGGGGC